MFQYKHSFPPHHKQDQTTPSGIFPSDYQLSTITQCRNWVTTSKPLLPGSRRGEPGPARPGSAWTSTSSTVISISLLEQSKTRRKRQLIPCQALAPAAPFPPRLHAGPSYIKRLFINKKVCQVLGRARVTLSSAFPRHPKRLFFPAPCESGARPHRAPTSGRFEWHPLNQGARESIIPLSPQAERKRKRAPGSSGLGHPHFKESWLLSSQTRARGALWG